MKPDQDISLVPISLGEANEYMAKHIRQYHPTPGCKFTVGCALDGELVGAAIVGRCRDDAQAVQIDRIFSTGSRTAYGMLYGACARAAQALGYWRIIAFLPEHRPDSALRAAGWRRVESETGGKRAAKMQRYERWLMVCRRRKEAINQ